MRQVDLETSAGTIRVELDDEKAPETVKNFLTNVENGHFDGTVFHRVIKGFMVQGGGFEPGMTQKPTGSTIKTELRLRDGRPVLARLPQLDFLDDKAGKPVAINKFIGRRPIAAFGNSDGDLEMLQWATAGEGRRFGLIVRHDDWPAPIGWSGVNVSA